MFHEIFMSLHLPRGRINTLRNRTVLTQSSLRQAVSETVRHIQGSGTDQDMADSWGVSAGTVVNARNRNHDLSSLPLLKLGERFKADGLNTVLALIGLQAAPVDNVIVDVSSVPCEVAKCVPLLIQLLADGQCCNSDVRQLDDAGVIDSLGEIADMLRQRRDRLRLTVVA